MKGNLSACLKVTLPHEGGYVDHPSDPGGATNMGITIGTLSAWRGRKVSKAEVKALTLDEAERIYQKNYWNPIRGDSLPVGVDLATFDFGVNSGTSRASKYLQAVVGAAQDGVIGPATLTAVSRRDGVDVIKALCAKRLGFVRGLKTFSVFGRGWSRRIADVEAKAVAMALRSYGVSPAGIMSALTSEAKEAEGRAKSNGSAASGAGAIGGGGAFVSTGTDLDWLIVGAFVVAAFAVAIAMKSRANVNRDRADAYAAVAKTG